MYPLVKSKNFKFYFTKLKHSFIDNYVFFYKKDKQKYSLNIKKCLENLKGLNICVYNK